MFNQLLYLQQHLTNTKKKVITEQKHVTISSGKFWEVAQWTVTI